MQDIIERKQFASILHGGPSNYQNFRRVIQLSPSIYSHDLSIYTDDVYQRQDRNMAQLRKLKNLITKQNKITPEMLSSNTWNTFYPSYVLDHHYRVFMKIIRSVCKSPLGKKSDYLKIINDGGERLDFIGAFFQHTQQMNFKTCHQVSNLPQVYEQMKQNKKWKIKMNPDHYFYAKNTSALITHCAFLTNKGICICKIRNQDGSLISTISIKDFGATISSDYNNVGYNFNGAQIEAEAIIPLKKQIERNLMLLKNDTLLQQFKYSLNDLKKSLYLTIKYTQMRRQFATLQGTKQERRIITYQAVASRILDGYSTLSAFSFLALRLQMIPRLAIFFTPILQYSHHTLLERVIHLRQCCGGFGYLQYSGHPASIQRIAYRAANKQDAQVPSQNKQFMKRAHYYSGDDNLESFFGDKIEIDKIFNFSQLWRIFILICIQMRKKRSQLSKTDYTRQFVKQSAIQAMYNFDSMGRMKVDNISLLLQYQVAWYILENGKFINWSYLAKIQPNKFYEGVQNFKRNLTIELSKSLSTTFVDLLEIDIGNSQNSQSNNIRNAIVGRQNSDDFYNDVMNAAKSNKRNSKEFLDYVKEPIVQMLNQNRGSSGKL